MLTVALSWVAALALAAGRRRSDPSPGPRFVVSAAALGAPTVAPAVAIARREPDA